MLVKVAWMIIVKANASSTPGKSWKRRAGTIGGRLTAMILKTYRFHLGTN